MRTNKAKSPGVSIRSDQKEYHCFPRVGWGAGRREVVPGLICCWAGDGLLEKSCPSELEVTVLLSQITRCSQTWHIWCSALYKKMCCGFFWSRFYAFGILNNGWNVSCFFEWLWSLLTYSLRTHCCIILYHTHFQQNMSIC